MESTEADFPEDYKDDAYEDFFSAEPKISPAKPPATNGYAQAESSGPAVFALDDDDDDDCVDVSADAEQSEAHFDCRAPELPEPLAHFTDEDLILREVLGEFYLRFRADNIVNVNKIIEQYRGRGLTHLFAALALKYNLEAADVVEMVTRSLYVSSPFEHAEERHAAQLEERLKELRTVVGEGIEVASVRTELLQSTVETCVEEDSYSLLKMLCFRGIPAPELRPQIWKVLLGYLPRQEQADWPAIQREKRSLYASHKERFLAASGSSARLEIKTTERPLSESMEMLSQIQKDVARTRQEVEFFQQASTRNSLIALLFVYAQMNPDVRYVQGMNEVAAVIFYVMSLDAEFVEHDTFWCFSLLMEHIKPGFMAELDQSSDGIYALVNSCERLLRRYDPQLARHLHNTGSPQFVVIFRWCTLLFAQDATLEDVLQLWDSFLADPSRFELVVHTCLALMLSCREALLATEDDFELAEVLRAAPRRDKMDLLLRRSWAVCALERRAQTPAFPVKSAAQIVEQVSEWAQGAASKAQELRAAVAEKLQQNVAPALKERASQATSVAREATKDKAQAVQSWLQETAPVRREALEKAQSRFSTLLHTTTSVAKTAAQKFVETM